MAERVCRFAEVHVDFGTGDGVFAYRTARQQPSTLVIGTDANAEGLRELSRRALRKPARGGLPNVLFGRLSLEDAPGELVQLADAVSVLFPWGSLLRAVAMPECEGLRKLALIGKPGARFRFLYGYGIAREARAVEELGLPALGGSSILRALEDGYEDAGLQVEGRYVTREEIALNQTTWAKKIAFSDRERVFVELSGISSRAVGNHARFMLRR